MLRGRSDHKSPQVRRLLERCPFRQPARARPAPHQHFPGREMFGTRDQPGGFAPVSADAGKMLAFTTADGHSRFELFSIPNTRHEFPAQFARRAENRQERLDYKRITRNFIAASTIQSGRTLYRRCNFSRGMIHCIDLRYPAVEERAWDSTVTRISLSLRPR